MTAQQTKTIITITDKLAADRWIADQAARETSELDALSVLYAIQVKLAEGRVEEARQMYREWKKGQ